MQNVRCRNLMWVRFRVRASVRVRVRVSHSAALFCILLPAFRVQNSRISPTPIVRLVYGVHLFQCCGFFLTVDSDDYFAELYASFGDVGISGSQSVDWDSDLSDPDAQLTLIERLEKYVDAEHVYSRYE